MTCPYAEDDAAFILGALDPAEHAAFARHLPGCATCREAVVGLADLPGLLARAHAGAPDLHGDAAPPAELLTGLLGRVRRERRTTRWRSAGTVLVVAAAAAGVVAVLPDNAPGPPAGSTSAPSSVVQLVGAAGVSTAATVVVQLTAKAWGTEVDARCSYFGPPHAGPVDPVRYTLVVIDAAGEESAVSSWNAVSDQVIAIPGSTQLPIASIDRLELRTDTGLTVLHSN